jgi:low affinity Fe/Cu permease
MDDARLAPIVGEDVEIVRSHGPALRTSHALTRAFGSPWAVVGLAAGTVAWLIAGSITDYSRAWELVATVGIPIVALLALFVVQHTQNHNGRALQLKLDELLRAMGDADGRLVAVEDVDEHGLRALGDTYRNDLDGSGDGDSRVDDDPSVDSNIVR